MLKDAKEKINDELEREKQEITNFRSNYQNGNET